MKLYEDATGPESALKRSELPGKTLAEKRKLAVVLLLGNVGPILERECYPKLRYQVREDADG